MPTENGRGLDEQGCFAPSWRDLRGEDNHEALPGSPPNTTGELSLCDDKLLTKKRVLRDQVYAAANEIRDHPGNEPKEVDHVSLLHRLRVDGICSQDGLPEYLRLGEVPRLVNALDPKWRSLYSPPRSF